MTVKIKVIYEDKDILAIEKPTGILVHPAAEQARNGAGPDKEETILSIFKKKYPKLEIAHRLDKETSGVMLLAKNKKAHEFLKKQFQDRTIKKTYVAIVSGHMKHDRGVINKPIGRSPADFRRYSAGRGARGEMREAETRYKVIKRFTLPSPSLRKEGKIHQTPPIKFTYLELYPKTGRTHQIRVHLKYLNHPVAGDSLYNPENSPPPTPSSERRGRSKGGGRMMLHAKSIEFKNLKGDVVKIESPIHKEFKKIVE